MEVADDLTPLLGCVMLHCSKREIEAFPKQKEATMKNELFDQWVEFSKNANEPLLQLSEITAHAMEQVARQQMDLARDYMELGTRQVELLGSAADPQKWLSEQSALATEFGNKLMGRAKDFAAIATETQKSVSDWAETAAKKAAKLQKASKDKAA